MRPHQTAFVTALVGAAETILSAAIFVELAGQAGQHSYRFLGCHRRPGCGGRPLHDAGFAIDPAIAPG